MATPEARERQAALWLAAAKSLGIEVVAPFLATFDGAAELKAAALVRDFGAGNGMVVDPDWDTTLKPVSAALSAAGYGCSAVDISEYEEGGIIEMLRDWGWTGRRAHRPAWLQVIRFVNPPELAPPPGYSNVVEIRGGRLVYIAGQTAFDRDGTLVGEGNLEAQADQVFRNLAAALAAVGCTARDVAKLTVYVRDMGQLAAYRRARDRFFATTTPPAAPAITLVEVSKLFDDKLLIEIEAVAVADR